MIKTHQKSRICRIAEYELEQLDGVIIQIEHIAEPIRGVYHCFVEVVDKNNYITDTEHDMTVRAINELREKHEKLCSSILSTFGEPEDAATAEIKERSHLSDALELAYDWFC